MVKTVGLVHSLSGSLPALRSLSTRRVAGGVLRRLMTSPHFRDLRNVLLKGEHIEVQDFDIDALFDDLGDFDVRITVIYFSVLYLGIR